MLSSRTNPILPMVRQSLTNWDEDEQADGPWDERFFRWQQYAENGDIEPDEEVTDAHFAHAIRVLSRLARIAALS